MSSIQLRALNRQGSASAASGANASHGETSSAAAAGSASSATPGYSPGPSLQQQQRLSLERARLRTQTTTTSPGHTTVVQQSPTPPQAAAQQASQTPNSNTQRNSDGRLRSLWKKIVKERGFEVAVVGIILAVIVMAPTFGSYATGVWSSAKDYQDWCKSEKSANHTLTHVCSLIVNRPLPPPPGLDQVFKDIARPEPIPVTPPKVWKRATEEELEMAYAFIRGPVGNGLSLMFFGFFLLMMPLEDKDLKWAQFLFVYSAFMITRKATIIFVLRNVSLMMDWAFWLRRVGAKGPSWSSLMVLPVLYAVGYMNEKSFATQMTISIISGLVVGDEYSHKLIFVYQFMMQLGYRE